MQSQNFCFSSRPKGLENSVLAFPTVLLIKMLIPFELEVFLNQQTEKETAAVDTGLALGSWFFPEIRSVHRIWSQTWEVQCRHLYWKWFLNLDAGGFVDSGWYLCAACGTWWTQNHLQQATQHLSAQWENSGSIFFVVQSLRSQQHLLIYSIAGSKWLKIRNSCDVNETILTLAGMNLDLFCHMCDLRWVT